MVTGGRRREQREKDKHKTVAVDTDPAPALCLPMVLALAGQAQPRCISQSDIGCLKKRASLLRSETVRQGKEQAPISSDQDKHTRFPWQTGTVEALTHTCEHMCMCVFVSVRVCLCAHNLLSMAFM